MRIPLAATLESRDGTVTRDACVLNGIVEARGDGSAVRKRPGLSESGLIRAGVAQALGYWNSSIAAVTDDYLHIGNSQTDAAWNPADKGTNITLSGSNLIATVATGTADGVRATFGKSSGKWYWEIKITDATRYTVQIGVGNSSASLTAATWGFIDDNNGVSLNFNGFIQKNRLVVGADSGSTFTFGVGDIIGVALDMDNRTVGWNKNGGAFCYITGSKVPTGDLYPMVAGTQNTGPIETTARFTSSATTGTPPSGYTDGLSVSSGAWVATSSTNISPTTADLQFSMQDNGRNAPGGALLMFKNRQQGWYANSAGTVTQITDVDYPGTYAVTLTSLTRSGTTATATTPTDTNFQVGGSVTIAGVNEAGWNGAYTITGVTPSVTVAADNIAVTITRSGTTATATCVYEPHGFANGQSVTISGAEQSEYNGTKTITWLSATTFSFTVTVSNSQVTTATGSPVMAGEAVNIRIADNLGTYGNTNDLTKIYVVPQYGNFFTTGESVTIQSNLYPGLNGTHTAGTVTTVGGLECNFEITVSGFATPIYAKANIGTISRTGASISSITLSNGVATVTTSSAHNLVTGSKVRISGCTQYYFNGLFTVTVTGSTTYTYSVSANIANESPATPATGTILARAADTVTGASFTITVDGTETTPATGTITATSGRNTVPGIAYIDGYFVVMDVNGVIYNSALNDPSAWSALDYLTAQAETGAGKFLGRSQSYVVAFKEWSTEFFYNAGNEIGSPLSPVPNAFTQVGCASGESVAKVDGNLAWISQTREKGRSVHVMQGMQQAKVSTADVERILNADDLATVRAFGIKLDGHPLYVVTLGTSDITLVYDFASQTWARWSSLTIGSSVSVSSITRSNSTATVTCAAAHGLSDGDPVKISGAGQAGYNGIFQVSRSSATVFTIEVDGSPTTPATGTIVCYPYTESYFKFTHAAAGGGYDYVLHESNGYSYVVDPNTYQDAGAPIDFFLRTQRLDGGESALKKMGRVVLVGDKQSDTAMIRWSDDDSATFSAYRRVTLSDDEPMLRRCGSFRRRSLEVRHIGNTAQRFAALEMEVSK